MNKKRRVITDDAKNTGYLDGYDGIKREPSESSQEKEYEDGYRKGARDGYKHKHSWSFIIQYLKLVREV